MVTTDVVTTRDTLRGVCSPQETSVTALPKLCYGCETPMTQGPASDQLRHGTDVDSMSGKLFVILQHELSTAYCPPLETAWGM